MPMNPHNLKGGDVVSFETHALAMSNVRIFDTAPAGASTCVRVIDPNTGGVVSVLMDHAALIVVHN